jgi:hypothetical protein
MNETSPDTGTGGIKCRKLRIAVSAMCGVICLLLIALWVRSNWWADYLQVNNGKLFDFYIEAQRGELFVCFGPPVNASSWIDYGHHEVEMYYRNFDYTVVGFYFGNDEMFPGIFIIDLPFWFLVPATAALAAGPWIHWSRRFSLRTLIIAMTLIAVLLGLIFSLAA